jgi:hypothetical protein
LLQVANYFAPFFAFFLPLAFFAMIDPLVDEWLTHVSEWILIAMLCAVQHPVKY